MKSKKLSLCALVLGSAMLFNSCIGSFGLWNTVLDWNKGVGNKFVNELVFVACNIIPVYAVCYVVDLFVLNSIEFWSGSNPMANAGEVKTVKGKDGDYLVKNLENGYSITKDDQEINLVYNQENNTWNLVADEINTELVKINNNGTADLYLPNGETLNVTMDAQGMIDARQVTMHTMFYAAR